MIVRTPLHATVELARRVDRAEVDFCAVAGGYGLRGGVQSLEVGGGRALYGRPGSPLNKVLGLGLEGPVSDADLDRIEAFYARHNAPVQIELCPIAPPDLAPRLASRGYVVQSFENEVARLLEEWSLDEPGEPAKAGPYPNDEAGAGFSRLDDVSVTRTADPDDEETWVRVTAEGFEASEEMTAVMRQFAHPSIVRYLARIGGEPAGGGAAFLNGGVLGIFGTATTPRFRRRGVQTAIAWRSLMDARGEADLAIATVAPGSASQRTFERLGFQVLYTRVILVRPAT
jgi:hypothetical protein